MSSPGISLPLIQQQPSMPVPLESAPTSTTEGIRASAYGALENTLGESLLTKGVGALEGGPPVPHAQAVKAMQDQNYDPKVLPAGDVSQGTLSAIMNQQSAIARSRDIASRSGAPGIAKTVAGLAGGMGDPLFLLAGPALGRIGAAVAPELEGAVGATGLTARGVRAGVGGLEAGGAMTAYMAGEQHFGTAQGDRDITMYDAASQVAIATLFGGGIGGLTHSPVTSADVSRLERSAEAAKIKGVPVNEVVSPAGAVGEHQIMPSTAAAYGIPASALKDPAVNKHIADMLLTELNKKYPSDPEAVSIAYNAGPKVANKWLLAGRDDGVLPKETQEYVAHLREMRGMTAEGPEARSNAVDAPKLPPDVMKQAGETAITQFIADAPIDVKPTVADALETTDGLSPSRALGADQGFKGTFTGENPYGTEPIPKDATTEAAPTPAEQRLAEVRDEAASIGPHTAGEADPEFVALEEKMRGGDAEADEQSRGLEAAVRCGAIRGFS